MLSLYRAFKRQLITFLLVTICNWFIQPCDFRRMIESSGPINLTDIDFANEQSDFHPKYSNIYFTYSGLILFLSIIIMFIVLIFMLF